jgi:hypothetical protein
MSFPTCKVIMYIIKLNYKTEVLNEATPQPKFIISSTSTVIKLFISAATLSSSSLFSSLTSSLSFYERLTSF